MHRRPLRAHGVCSNKPRSSSQFSPRADSATLLIRTRSITGFRPRRRVDSRREEGILTIPMATQPLWAPPGVNPLTGETAPLTSKDWAARSTMCLDWPRIAADGRDQSYGGEASDKQFGQDVSHSLSFWRSALMDGNSSVASITSNVSPVMAIRIIGPGRTIDSRYSPVLTLYLSST